MPRHCPNVPLNVRLPVEVEAKFNAICEAGNEKRTQTAIAIINFAYDQIIKNREKENKGGEADGKEE